MFVELTCQTSCIRGKSNSQILFKNKDNSIQLLLCVWHCDEHFAYHLFKFHNSMDVGIKYGQINEALETDKSEF